MRIRKRQVPPPLSDPRSIHPSPMVQLPHASSHKSSVPLLLQQQPDTAALTASLLDHTHPLPPMGKPEDPGHSAAIVAESGAHDHHTKADRSDEAGGGRDGGGEKRNDTGKGVISGSGTVSEVIPPSPSNLDGKWCDGEKAIPPKKRRGRGGDYMMNTRDSNSNNSKKMKTRMKTKMNKKCTRNNDDDDDERNGEDEEEGKGEVNMDVNTSKKRGRGSLVMVEGSRCSRVNGRGWRCCQQTLVGYSLCEHHLGKGRLRSITSVRSRSIPSATTASTKNNDSLSSLCAASSSSSPEKRSICDSSGIHNDIDEKKPAVITKKRMKLGMVKARSISSLLGQTNTLVTLHDNDK
ncbi:uncharacterized protein LOC114745839 [Neltuma alba]|uniref:uncharacterized protein LOC114745839 n=1 Tax=Neltuma alba TaxID=207710 RepID=UPI0010A30799|nr:uncharacterized protein LOC114745839 [Prosopis alba]